jgi:type II secretory pathway component PulM
MIAPYARLWTQKTAEQKRNILVRATALLALLLALWMVFAIIAVKQTLQQQAEDQAQLLEWMQIKVPELMRLKNTPEPKALNKDLFSVVEETIKKHPDLFKMVSLSRQSETVVSLHFTKVPFETLMEPLLGLKQQYDIDVAELNLNQQAEPAMVEGSVVLSIKKPNNTLSGKNP